MRATELVRSTMAHCDGAAAVDAGDVIGFLTSLELATDPASPMARYAPERASVHLVHGHAVAAGADPGRIYGSLFGELAERAVASGLVDYSVHVPLGDPAIETAWVALGFGRLSSFAVRGVDPIDRAIPPDVEIRKASPDELDIVDRLVDEEAVFHAGSPIFRPYRRSATVDAVRAEIATRLASDDDAFLIARPRPEGHRGDLGPARIRFSIVRSRRRRLHRRDGGASRSTGIRGGFRARRGRARLGAGPWASCRVPALFHRQLDVLVVLAWRRLRSGDGLAAPAARRAHCDQPLGRRTVGQGREPVKQNWMAAKKNSPRSPRSRCSAAHASTSPAATSPWPAT